MSQNSFLVSILDCVSLPTRSCGFSENAIVNKRIVSLKLK